MLRFDFEAGGKTYKCFYHVKDTPGLMVTVKTPWGEKSKQVGNSPAVVIAKMMARELLETFRQAH